MARAGRSSGSRKLKLPTASGILTRAAYARAINADVDVKPLLRKAGLTSAQIQNETTRLSVKSQITFLNVTGEALQDDFLGFHIARDFELREIGTLFYVLSSSDTLGDALQRGARYITTANEGVRVTYSDAKRFEIKLEYVEVARHRDRHQMEFLVTTVVRLSRHLTGRRLAPSRVKFIHYRSRLSSDFRSFFCSPITFGCATDEVAFHKTVGRLPLPSRDPYLNKILIACCEKVQSDRQTPSVTLQLRVENAIAPLLPHGKVRAPQVARELGMSRRTLGRRLASEGLTFAAVLDNFRYDLAKHYLRQSPPANINHRLASGLPGGERIHPRIQEMVGKSAKAGASRVNAPSSPFFSQA